MTARQPQRTFNKALPWKDKKKQKCTHCEYLNHTADKCFKIIGYPPGWKGTRGLRTLTDIPVAHAVNLDQSTEDKGPSITFNQDLYQQFLAFAKTQQKSSQPPNTIPQTAATITTATTTKVHLPNGSSVPIGHVGKVQISGFLIMSCDLANKRMTGFSKEKDGLYHLITAQDKPTLLSIPSSSTAHVSQKLNYNLWHCRLGHISSTRMSKIPCMSSHILKKLPFPVSISVSNKIFDLVHCDIWGPFHVSSFEGYRFFLTIVDEMTIQDAHFYNSCGIINQRSRVTSPQQNGIVERKHTRALLFQSNMLFQKPPAYDHLKTFGCLCFASTLSNHRTKFSPRASRCIFVGYALGYKGYKVYDLENHKTFSHDNLDTISDHASPIPPSIDNLPHPRKSNRTKHPPSYLHDYHCDLPSSNAIQPSMLLARRSTSSKPFSLSHFISTDRLVPKHKALVASISNVFEPKFYGQAIKFPHWQVAMNFEIQALEKNNKWTLTNLPPNKHTIGCKWVYKVKFKPDGIVERYKARLVAKGYTQQEGLDFFDTFSPVAKLTSIRVLLTVAAVNNWSKHGISLCQRKYALDVLEDFGFSGCKPVAFPMDSNLKLKLEDADQLSDPSSYRRLIGKLIYLTITRLDLAYSVQVLNQFMSSPAQSHLNAAHRVLRYLKATPGQRLFFPSNSNLHLKAYSDSDWAGCLDTKRSITSFAIFLGDPLLADVLTKPLGSIMFHTNISKIGILNIHAPLEGGSYNTTKPSEEVKKSPEEDAD
ncbi:uncharacterized protein LOC111409520 [Olea europaea var. sylvestris]|uniref:uncharacterized protein LOC111409520 n=1 Tax=Olea europaea var. sylvestris TaxID=158386 RepID=UPI000C1CEE84|nr:uncharacterized protein LOC111409520 [Olea europaea var. sylvestris]